MKEYKVPCFEFVLFESADVISESPEGVFGIVDGGVVPD